MATKPTPKEVTIPYSIRLRPDEVAALRVLAKRDNRSLASLIRHILLSYVEGTPTTKGVR
jgi:predicted DNA-binding protein